MLGFDENRQDIGKLTKRLWSPARSLIYKLRKSCSCNANEGSGQVVDTGKIITFAHSCSS